MLLACGPGDMDKIKVYSSQYSNFFGNNQIHFPYSIACLVSYCFQFKEITDVFDFEETFLFRSEIQDHILKASEAKIILCSCYSWNWEITKFLAKSVKAINPQCIIVFGGPEVPYSHDGKFFDENPFVDILVHGEGEITSYEILKQFASGLNLENLNIDGTETKFYRSQPRIRTPDISQWPSPYSTDLIWKLSRRDPNIKYIVSWETNRGCPFSCTFCDWGSSTMSKLRPFDEKRIFKEIEWFGKNNITYIDCCDGNFGIFQKRDHDIAIKLADLKKSTGFPERIGLTWVKTSSDRVIPIAKVLNDVDLLRAVSLSVQSLDPKTLEAIKRKNLKFDSFSGLIKKFNDEGIQSYTEMIMGLPEETVDSFKNNWEILASLDPQPAIMVWNCSIFVNAPMNNPDYMKRYGIKAFKSPQFMQHIAKKEKVGEIQEFEKMVCATDALPNGKIEEVYMTNWMMMIFHVFGITEMISRYYNKSHNLSYKQFYNHLAEYMKKNKTFIGKEYELARNHCKNGYSGQGWDYYDHDLGDISWPMEEASWLHLTRDSSRIKEELSSFLNYLNVETGVSITAELVEDLINYQLLVLSLPENRLLEEVKGKFAFDWVGYFNGDSDLIKGPITFSKKTKVTEHDIVKWGYETIWYGRRSYRYKTKVKEIHKTYEQ